MQKKMFRISAEFPYQIKKKNSTRIGYRTVGTVRYSYTLGVGIPSVQARECTFIDTLTLEFLRVSHRNS